MNLNKLLILSFFLAIAVTSCKKSGDKPKSVAVKADTDVYISGVTINDTNRVATYWKNGVATSLTTSGYSLANAITTDGTDIFIAGKTSAYPSSTKTKAVYWRNGVVTALTDGTTEAVALDIAVSGNNVYVAGIIDKAAVYWKNGVLTTLTDNTFIGAARGISVYGTDVYVCGDEYKNNALVPVYWKNGIANQLNDGTGYSSATGITVQNNNVFATYFNLNVLSGPLNSYSWQNGTANRLSPGILYSSSTNKILVNGSDVYITGISGIANNNYVEGYWKNDAFQVLSATSTSAGTGGIAAAGTDIYITGYNNGQGVYWKNGAVVNIGANAAPSGIAVIPH